MSPKLPLAALAFGLLIGAPALAQKKYTVKQDSPEERALLEIQGESDAAKRIAMLDDFRAKFASSEAAGAVHRLYLAAYVQLQQYDKALEAADKAVDADSDDLSVYVNAVRAAQAKSDY